MTIRLRRGAQVQQLRSSGPSYLQTGGIAAVSATETWRPLERAAWAYGAQPRARPNPNTVSQETG